MNLIPLDALSESAMLGESIRDGDLVSPSRCSVRCVVEKLASTFCGCQPQLAIAEWRATLINNGMPFLGFSYQQ